MMSAWGTSWCATTSAGGGGAEPPATDQGGGVDRRLHRVRDLRRAARRALQSISSGRRPGGRVTDRYVALEPVGVGVARPQARSLARHDAHVLLSPAVRR